MRRPSISCYQILIALALCPTTVLFGCGAAGAAPQIAPVITQQPLSQTVPLGSAAGFSVTATGSSPLIYQWAKNNEAIPSGTSATYTTGPLALSDANNTFNVTIKNSAGTVVSQTVTVTIGPRSPASGDLRFQQVDAATTLNGYEGRILINFSGNQTDQFSDSTGAPMSIGPGCTGPGPTTCYWLAQVFTLPQGVTGYSASYGDGGHYADLAAGLQALQNPQSIISGIDIGQLTDSYGVSTTQSVTASGLEFVAYTVPTSDLQAAIAAEGLKSRVVTAISWNGPNVTFLSYGWATDTATTYDTLILTATYSNVDQIAKQLAQGGYIITACGGDAYSTGLWMVGTKVTGDTLPRPILVFGSQQSPQPIADGGYALVALFSQDGSPTWWVGER